MNSASKRFFALVIGVACLVLALPVWAAEEGPPSQHQLQFRGRVVVGPDGNGVLAASLQTTVEGPEVRYVLLVDSVCGDSGATCSPLAESISIELNGDVVFQSDDLFDAVRAQVALNAAGGEPNRLVVTAFGAPGGAARVSVLAVRPADVPVGGRSIRVLFFNPDGSLAGRSGPRALPPNATENLDLSQVVGTSGLQWSRGAVHVQWASRGFTRVSTAAREEHREPDRSGVLRVVRASELALDDYGPAPLSRAALQDIFEE